MALYCSNCNFKGASKQSVYNIMIECLYLDKWCRENNSCAYWRLHDSQLSMYERVKLVNKVRNRYNEYEKYLQQVTNAGIVSLLGSIAIFFIIFIVAISVCILNGMLQ